MIRIDKNILNLIYYTGIHFTSNLISLKMEMSKHQIKVPESAKSGSEYQKSKNHKEIPLSKSFSNKSKNLNVSKLDTGTRISRNYADNISFQDLEAEVSKNFSISFYLSIQFLFCVLEVLF